MQQILSPSVFLPSMLEQLHSLGHENADTVDRDARLPHETFAALRYAKLLGCYMPVEFGGMGFTLLDLGGLCEVLAHYCSSTAMFFAMQQFQVACIIHHAMASGFSRSYLRELLTNQHLLAAATIGFGLGGDARANMCAVVAHRDRLALLTLGLDMARDTRAITCRHTPASAQDCSLALLPGLGYTRLSPHAQPRLRPAHEWRCNVVPARTAYGFSHQNNAFVFARRAESAVVGDHRIGEPDAQLCRLRRAWRHAPSQCRVPADDAGRQRPRSRRCEHRLRHSYQQSQADLVAAGQCHSPGDDRLRHGEPPQRFPFPALPSFTGWCRTRGQQRPHFRAEPGDADHAERRLICLPIPFMPRTNSSLAN